MTWWQRTKAHAEIYGWGTMIAWWVMLAAAIVATFVALRLIAQFMFFIFGQTPPDQLL